MVEGQVWDVIRTNAADKIDALDFSINIEMSADLNNFNPEKIPWANPIIFTRKPECYHISCLCYWWEDLERIKQWETHNSYLHYEIISIRKFVSSANVYLVRYAKIWLCAYLICCQKHWIAFRNSKQPG